MRHFLLSYSVLAAFSSLGAAAPKFAFNRADFVPKSHSPKAHHTTITNPPRATVSHASLELRDPAVEHMIDAVRPNSQSTIASVSVSVSASAVSQACEPFITLEARVPAVNRINAVGSHAVRASPGARAPCPVLSGSSSFLEAAERLEPRDPAVNRIDAVGQDTIGQSVLSLAGGSPVTLDAGEILELDAAA